MAASDRDAHRDRDRTVIVEEDPYFDAYWAWGWEAPWYPAPYPAGYAYMRAHKGLVPVELHVHPWKASVVVDQSTLGQARDYNDDTHPLWLSPGKHVLELQYSGYRILRFDLDVAKGVPLNLHYRLNKGKGLDPRSPQANLPGNVTGQHPS